MKERLTKISLQAFRGACDAYEIKLDQGQSLLMYGENGTGKSTLADAIEWYFTGEIELLAKEGRDHAVRHLGASKTLPTLVQIGTNGKLGGSCALKTPNEAAIEAASRETFLLRGRTIADFVDKSKGEKWSALQKLLGLGSIDELRTDLQKARTELKRTRDGATAKVKQAAAAIVAQKVEPENLDAALAKLAQACGFEPQDTIDDYAKLDLLALIDPKRTPMSSRHAATATLVAELGAATIEIDTKALDAWNETLDSDRGDPTHVDVIAAASRFVKAHPDAKQCPVCDKKVGRRDAEDEDRGDARRAPRAERALFRGGGRGAQRSGRTGAAATRTRALANQGEGSRRRAAGDRRRRESREDRDHAAQRDRRADDLRVHRLAGGVGQERAHAARESTRGAGGSVDA